MIQVSFFSFSNSLGKAEKLRRKRPLQRGSGNQLFGFSHFPPLRGSGEKDLEKLNSLRSPAPLQPAAEGGQTEKPEKLQVRKGSQDGK